MRDGVVAGQAQAGGLLAEHVERGVHGTDHEMAAVAGQVVGTLAAHVDLEPVVEHLGLEPVVHREREPQGVVAGTEVGGGRGRANGDGP